MAQLLFSADFRTINPPYAGKNVTIGGVVLPYAQMGAFVVAVVLAGLLFLVLDKTRTGRAIRATAQNLTAARLYGVNPKRIYAITFGAGAALAGAAGGLYGIVSQITPYIGVTLTAKSFVIAILGGLDKPLGVVGGGLILGIAEAMAALYLDPTYTDIISFGLLVVVLVGRPAQLLGRA
jgi:branched-chain amino acid transport system permease protein